MANTTITALPAATTPLAGTEVVPIVQSGVTKKVAVSAIGGGSGTVTSVSVATANGLAGTVATSTTTPAITLSTTVTGVLKGSGSAISAATAGTDYLAPPSGTSILKGNSGGALANAVANTDYQSPIALTTVGTSGAATFNGTTLNIPNYTSGGGSGTVTSVGISAPAFLSVGGSPVTSSGTLALTYSGTALPVANGGTGQTSANAALNGLLPSQTSQSGKVLSTDGTNTSWTAVSGTGTVQSVSVVSANGFAGTVANATTNPAITLSTSVTGILKGNGSTISAAASGTDYAPATSGTSILYGNGAGGFSNVTVGSGLSFITGTLSATGGGGGSPAGTNTQVQYNNSGSFGAAGSFTFDVTTATVTANKFAGEFNGAIGGNTPSYGYFTTATARSSAVQDYVTLQGRAGGTNSYGVTLTPTTLTGIRTLTLPDASGTILQSGTAVTVEQGGTGIQSGTSGGVPYFSATNTIASSAALVSNALMVGGGAGTAPSTVTTGTGVVTALGVNTGSAGAFVVNGGALGTPSGGTVTNLSGTASININGTVGATTPTTGIFTTATARSTAVQDFVALQGRAGGTNSYGVTLTPTTLTASRTLTLPDASGTILQSGTTVTVGQGGTGASTLTGILKGNGTSAFTAATSGTDYSAGTSALTTGIVKSTTSTGALSIAVANTDYQSPITLTTSGSSGAATFVGNTLNIPVYTGGGSSGPILESQIVISQNYSLSSNTNGFSVGPVSVATGYAVTVGTGQTWLVSQ